MADRTYTLTFNSLTLDTTNLRMDKRGGQEVIDYFFLDDTYTIQDDEIVDVATFRRLLEEGDETTIVEIDGDRTVLKVEIDLYPIHKPDPPTLACMKTHMDGAHCGLGDWYDEIEQGIQEALNQGPEHEWTTGWYASKKEIASARITNAEGGIRIEVSVSDDFDTPGMGERVIQHTTDLETIRTAIYEAWEGAEDDQKDNRAYAGYSILTEVDLAEHWKGCNVFPEPKGKGQVCIDYYIACVSPFDEEFPPGDNYHEWGFQGGSDDVPKHVRDQLAEWAERHKYGDAEGESLTVEGYTIKPWDENKIGKD